MGKGDLWFLPLLFVAQYPHFFSFFFIIFESAIIRLPDTHFISQWNKIPPFISFPDLWRINRYLIISMLPLKWNVFSNNSHLFLTWNSLSSLTPTSSHHRTFITIALGTTILRKMDTGGLRSGGWNGSEYVRYWLERLALFSLLIIFNFWTFRMNQVYTIN